jgi:hypothetical protein
LSKRTNSRTRLQRRDEREARRLDATPRARRERGEQTRAGQRRGGFLAGISATALAAIAGVAVIAAIIVYAVVQTGNTGDGSSPSREAERNDSPSIAGVYYPPHPGADGKPDTRDERQHFARGTVFPICTESQLESGNVSDPLCYTSNPPTSGPHSDTPQGFGNMENPAPKENVLHSMEHGGVYIWYNTSDQAAIDLLKSVVNDARDQRKFVGSTVYTEMEPETIAITSWTRLDKFPVGQLTKERLQEFINDNHKRFNPEGF